jgi:DHA2 family multidrug resistance protein-like MFS transporter
MVAMVSLVYALMEVAIPEAGLLGATFAGVIGMMVMVIFVRRLNRSSGPMIDFSLFSNGRLTAGVLTAIIATSVAFCLLPIRKLLYYRREFSPQRSPGTASIRCCCSLNICLVTPRRN